MFSFVNYNNADAAVIKLFKYLSVNIDPDVVVGELEKHPDYPSLLSISDVLTAFHIEHAAFRVSPEEVVNVPYPFIAHTNLNRGDFVVVNKIEKENVLVSSEKWNRHKISREEFKKIFKGVVLKAEPSADFTKAVSKTSFLNTLKTPAIAAAILLMLVSALVFNTGYFTQLNWQTILLTLFKTAGLLTSILLLIQSIDSNNPLVQVLCQTKGKTNCNAILSSKAAKVFEGLTWSEVGFFYFAGTWLLLLFGGSSTATWQVLAVLNFISLPYTIYSIYYQARVAKQWCVLCCTVQTLLWLEFIPLAAAFNMQFRVPVYSEWSGLFIAIMLPVVLWMLLKPLFLKLQQLRPLKEQLRKFKYDPELFRKMHTSQAKSNQPDEEWCVVLGNVEANNIITVVTNPYCPPCAETHKLLDELLEQNGDVQARIVFTANNTDNDIKTTVSRHLMALNELQDKTIIRNALHDWYEQKQKNYEAWAKIYPAELKETEYYKIDKQYTWCQMAEVTATPTILLNGYRLPDLYQLPDLKYMLE